MYEEILDQMQELLKDEIKNFSEDFGKLEQAVMVMMMLFGKELKERESWLWDGQTRKLLNDLQKQHKKHRGRKREELAKLHKYIRDNEQEMRYDVFRGKGYDIGSGAVEGACKHVVGKRLKQSGMI